MTELRRSQLLSPLHSARYKPVSFGSHSKLEAEMYAQTAEVRLLRTQLSLASEELKSLQELYTREVSDLRSVISTLRQEVDLMRFERDEAVVTEGEADISHLADQIISLRTEIDRLSAFLWKSQRDSVITQNIGRKGRNNIEK